MIDSQLHLRTREEYEGNIYQFYFVRTPTEAPFAQKQHPRKQHVTDGFGACHGCEIPFVFDRSDSSEFGIEGKGELALGDAMSAYWTNFAWNSNPNNSSDRLANITRLPVWKQFHRKTDAAIILDASEESAEISMAYPHPRAKSCNAFWDNFFHHKGWFSNNTGHYH